MEIKKSIAKIEEDRNNPVSRGKRNPAQDAKDEKYALSHRSGQFWSIEGISEDELSAAALSFLSKVLLIPASEDMQK